MLTSQDVVNQHFTPTQLRRGYDEREVDDFLDEVVETLRYYERGGRPGTQPPKAQPPEAQPPPRAEGMASRASRWLRGDPRG